MISQSPGIGSPHRHPPPRQPEIRSCCDYVLATASFVRAELDSDLEIGYKLGKLRATRGAGDDLHLEIVVVKVLGDVLLDSYLEYLARRIHIILVGAQGRKAR